MTEHSTEQSTERIVFVVRRWPSISDTWNAHPDKTFDEAIEWVKGRIAGDKASLSYDVVEVEITRQATVAARIEAVEVVATSPSEEVRRG